MRLLRLVQGLSLDVVLGAVAGGALAVFVTGADVPASWWFVLAAATWVVYTADHLADARRAGPGATNARHRLHAHHAGWLTGIAGVAAIAVTATAWATLPPRALVAGGIVGGLVLGHLAGVLRSFPRAFPKELSVALVYGAGIWCGPLALAARLDVWHATALALHLAAALLYLMFYALCDRVVDAADGSPSIAVTRGSVAVRGAMDRIAVPAAVLAALGAAAAPGLRPAFATLLVVLAVPVWLARVRAAVAPDGRGRLAELALVALAVPLLLR